MFNDFDLEYTIASLKLIPVVHKHGMVQRRNRLRADGSDITTLQNMVDEGGVHTGKLTRKLPNIYTMGLEADIGRIGIEGGWGSERFAFVLELRVEELDHQTGEVINTFVEFIQGYTNYDGADKIRDDVEIDRDMIFTINSIATAKLVNSRRTGVKALVPKDAYNVMCDPNGSAKLVHDENLFKILRPTDIVGTLATEETFGDDIPITSLSNTVTSNLIVPSDIQNKIGSRKLSTILNAGIAVSAKTRGTGRHKYLDRITELSGDVGDADYSDSYFMNKLFDHRSRYTVEFTADDLADIDSEYLDDTDMPDVSVSDVTLKAEDARKNGVLYSDMDLEDIKKPIEEARIASIVAEELSAIIFDRRVNMCSFTISTTAGSRRPVFHWVLLESLISIVDIASAGIAIEDEFKQYVLPKITDGGRQSVELLVHIDTLSISRVAISIDGDYFATFELPIYANSLFDGNIVNESKVESELSSWETLIDLTI
jgi:hypothetical protein